MEIAIAEGVVTAEVDGAAVLLSPDMSFIRLDETGSMIWQLLQNGCTEDSIANYLCENFRVEPDVALHDVQQFLQQLDDCGLLRLRP